MLTYLWNKKDNTGYIGLDGTTFDSAPTSEEIVALQQYSQRFVNDEEGYRTAFYANVAPKLGATSPYDYLQYYNTDDSCLPDICKVNAKVVNDGGDTRVSTSIYTADTGCRVLDFTFYNLCNDCIGTAGASNVYVRYTNQSCIDDNGGVYPPRSCMFVEATGHNVIGFLITENEDDTVDPSKYAWFQVTSAAGQASSYISYVFARSVSQPQTPSGGTYETGLPTSPAGVWFDSVPGRNNYPIWMSKRTFWSDEGDVIEHTDLPWSEPALMSDSKTFQTEWAIETTETNLVYTKQRTLPNLNEFRDETNIVEGINEQAWRAAASSRGCGDWSDDAEGATFMAWANCRNGDWEDWTVARIRGEAGEAGLNAGRTFMIFASLPAKDENDQDIVPEAPTGGLWDIENNVLLTNSNPPLRGVDNKGRDVTWSPDNNTVRGNVTWLSVGSFDGVYGRLIDPPGWSEPVRITGADGQDGVDGDGIEFIFARFEDIDAFNEYVAGTADTSSECSRMLAARDVEFSKNGTPWEERDYIPYSSSWVYEWFDHPEGIEEDMRVEACCMRQKIQNPDNPSDPTDTIWSDWVGPFIWASWGEDGIDGDGVEYIFCVTTTAIKSCKYKAISETAMTEDEKTNASTDYTELPDTDIYSDSDCDESPAFIKLTSGQTSTYYKKEVYYYFPEEPYGIRPPINFNEDCASQDNCRHCADSLYKSLCYGSGDYDKQKAFLDAYYQRAEFVPSNERIRSDWATRHNDDSPIKEVVAKFPEYDNDTPPSFLLAWDANWTDNPLDVGPQQPYEWVSIRKYKKGTHDTTKEWQPFSDPKLWANWAFDGTSTFTSMVFTRTNDDISGMELCGGTFELPYPGASSEDEYEEGCEQVYDKFKKRSEVKYTCPDCDSEKTYYWYDTVPADMDFYYVDIEYSAIPVENRSDILEVTEWPETVTERSPKYISVRNEDLSLSYYEKVSSPRDTCIWMSTKIFGDYITGENQGWSAPRRMSDTADFNVEWCLTNLTQTQIQRIKSRECNFGNFTSQVEDDDDIHSKAEALWEQYLLDNDLGAWSDLGDNAIYMATTTFRNGKWTNWTVSKIKGEKGDAGTGIILYGSTVGVVKEYSGLTNCVEEMMEPQPGDIWCVYDCNSNSEDIPCINDPTTEVSTSENRIQFFEYMEDGTWDCLACRLTYFYTTGTQEMFEEYEGEHPRDTAIYADFPSAVTVSSPTMIHITGTTESPLDEYYIKDHKRFVDEGVTIIMNGITDEAEGCQEYSADYLDRFYNIRNGDFFVWDTDSWRKVTNLMGPGSYLHVKFAKQHIGNIYVLTDETETENAGETPGKYMGMYVDNNKADFEGTWDSRNNYWYINDEFHPENPGPYKWIKVAGDDGLGYEYIYITTLTNNTTNPGEEYTNGRPFVPYFTDEFIESELYQQDGFIPKAVVTNKRTGVRVDITSAFTNGSYCVDWDDNAVTCDEDDRYRWKCYRMKSGGVWGPFVGDTSTGTEQLPNGKYATFDANYSVDGESIVIGDFDNDTVALGCTDSGYTAERMLFELTPLLYKGSSAYTVTACTPVNNAYSSMCSYNPSTNILTIDIPVGTLVIPTLKITFDISGYRLGEGNAEATATAMIIGIKGNVIYSLVVSKGIIKKDGQGNVMDDLPLTCNVVKRVVGSTTYEAVSSIQGSDEFRIWYKGNRKSVEDPDSTIEISGWFYNSMFDTRAEQQVITDKISFYLYTRIDNTLNWGASPNDNCVLNDVEVVYVVSDGEEGASPFVADLDNELDSIPLTYDGIVDGDDYDPESTATTYVEARTTVHLYYGTRPVEIDGITATTGTTQVGGGAKTLSRDDTQLDGGGNIKAHKGDEGNDNLITIKIRNGWDGFPLDPLEIRIFVSGNYNGQSTLNCLTFTLTGVRAGKEGEHATIYSLLPSSSYIVRNKQGGKEPPTITCQVLKKTGKTVDTLNYGALENEGLKILYYCDDDSSSYIDYYGAISTDDVDKFIRFFLVANTAQTITTNNLYDKETVPVIKDGLDGTSPFILDIDNELDSIPLTYDGVVDAAGDPYVLAFTTPTLYYGNRRATILSCSASTGVSVDGAILLDNNWSNLDQSGNLGALIDNDGTVNVRVKDGWTGFPMDPLEIRLFVSGVTTDGNNETLSRATFTLAGVKAGAQGESAVIYNLSPGSSMIVRDDDGTTTPNPLSCGIIKKTGRSVSDLSLNDLAGEGLKIMWCQDDDVSYSNNYTDAIPTGNIAKAVRFALIPRTATTVATDNIYDRETVPVVKNGSTGRGIIAKCDYWCVNEFSATTEVGFPNKYTVGSSPTGWTRIGTWYEDDDYNHRYPQTSTSAVPLPTDDYPYLWRWEKTWYTGDVDPTFETDPALVCCLSDEIVAIETWYIILEKTNDNISFVQQRYNAVVGGAEPDSFDPYPFINLALQSPAELGPGEVAGEAMWQFNRIIFAQKEPLCLGIEIVREYFQILRDIQILRDVFGEANVEGKRGAYLREFIGVMSSQEQGNSEDADKRFFNSQVAAFMNASARWRVGAEYKGRVMIAAGVKDLGGPSGAGNNWDESSDNTGATIDMNKFSATTVIWEDGLVECKKAIVEGSIHAFDGSFGGDVNNPDNPGFCRIGSNGLYGYASNGVTQLFSLTDTGVTIGATGATGNTIQLTPDHLIGIRSGATIFNLDDTGVYIGTTGDTVTLSTVNGLVGTKNGSEIFKVNGTGVFIGSTSDTIQMTTDGLYGRNSTGGTIFSLSNAGVEFGADGDNVKLTRQGLYGYNNTGGTIFSLSNAGVEFGADGDNVKLTNRGLYGYNNTGGTIFSLSNAGVEFGADGDNVKLTTRGLYGYNNTGATIFSLDNSGVAFGKDGDTVKLGTTGLTGYNGQEEVFRLSSSGLNIGGTGDTIQLSRTGLYGYSGNANNRIQIFSLDSTGLNIGSTGSTLKITTDGITGVSSNNDLLFKLDDDGLTANNANINGSVSGSTLHIKNTGATFSSELSVAENGNLRLGAEYTVPFDGYQFDTHNKVNIDENGIIYYQDNTRNSLGASKTEISNGMISIRRLRDLNQNSPMAFTELDHMSLEFTYYSGSGGNNVTNGASYAGTGITVMRESETYGSRLDHQSFEIFDERNGSENILLRTSGSSGCQISCTGDISCGRIFSAGGNATIGGVLIVNGSGQSNFGGIIRSFGTGESIFEGSLTIRKSLSVGSGITSTGNIYAPAFYEQSDARLKDVGEPLSNVLDRLEQIPTVYYKWRDHRDDKKHIGVIAQNVMSIFPELVTMEDDYYTVDYAKLSVVALAAIKELRTEVDALKDEIRKLKGIQ